VVEVLLKGLGLSSVAEMWYGAVKGLPGECFVGARA